MQMIWSLNLKSTLTITIFWLMMLQMKVESMFDCWNFGFKVKFKALSRIFVKRLKLILISIMMLKLKDLSICQFEPEFRSKMTTTCKRIFKELILKTNLGIYLMKERRINKFKIEVINKLLTLLSKCWMKIKMEFLKMISIQSISHKKLNVFEELLSIVE